MTHEMIAAATALADTLVQENEALEAMDLKRAIALLEAKRRCMEALAAAQSRLARGLAARLPTTQRAAAEQVTTRLGDLAAENKRLLERAMAVQKRVVGVVAQAASASVPRTPRYGNSGALAAPVRTAAMAISASV
jgi:hypothetical protein